MPPTISSTQHCVLKSAQDTSSLSPVCGSPLYADTTVYLGAWLSGHVGCSQSGLRRTRLPQTFSDMSLGCRVQETLWGISLTAQGLGGWACPFALFQLDSLKALCFLKWLYQLITLPPRVRAPVASYPHQALVSSFKISWFLKIILLLLTEGCAHHSTALTFYYQC